jgi:hypothetical protein
MSEFELGFVFGVFLTVAATLGGTAMYREFSQRGRQGRQSRGGFRMGSTRGLRGRRAVP